ncbi:MAG: fumarylacetoacetate hydrolase family protein [Gammaproteobacteria bacterium]
MRAGPASVLPQDGGILVGRAWAGVPGESAPRVVSAQKGKLYDLTARFSTVAGLLNSAEPSVAARAVVGLDRDLGPIELVVANTLSRARDVRVPTLLAPCDLQAIKASGVTFLISLQERVVEEAARGDPQRAAELRAVLSTELASLAGVRPGSAEAAAAKAWLIERSLWSQYLEVAIGPDAEIFTKAQPLSALGLGADIGILRSSQWNNPEPEVVLAVNHAGRIVGATLGNDVNLRDIEGRSGLLLGKAKDNNGSCAIGPFIRLFDAQFGLDDVRRAELTLQVRGRDGFHLHGTSCMQRISRDPQDLVRQTMGPHHAYPDGMMLFLGTMFAPTQDRDTPGHGFTHHVGDVVTIESPQLGTLVNRVDYCDAIEPWSYGFAALLASLTRPNGTDSLPM